VWGEPAPSQADCCKDLLRLNPQPWPMSSSYKRSTSLTLLLPYPPDMSLSLSLSLSHSLTHTHSLTLSLSHTHSLSYSVTHSPSISISLSLSLSLCVWVNGEWRKDECVCTHVACERWHWVELHMCLHHHTEQVNRNEELNTIVWSTQTQLTLLDWCTSHITLLSFSQSEHKSFQCDSMQKSSNGMKSY